MFWEISFCVTVCGSNSLALFCWLVECEWIRFAVWLNFIFILTNIADCGHSWAHSLLYAWSVASGTPSLAFLTYPASAHLPISFCHLGKHSEEDTLSAWPWGWVCERGAPSGSPWLPPFLWCALTGTQALTPTPSGLAVSSRCVWVLWNTGLYQPVGVVAISALTSSHPRSLFSRCTLTSHSIYSLYLSRLFSATALTLLLYLDLPFPVPTNALTSFASNPPCHWAHQDLLYN